VAAGLAPFAIGSETSGSIVTPASFCGVTALRPTYGLVSRYGAMALSWTLDKLGPFAHTAEDCGLILQTIAGKDGKDPGSAGKSFYYTPQYARPLKELKIGFAPSDFAEWAEPNTRPAFNAAIDVLKAGGAQFVETKLPDFPYGATLSTILNGEMGSIFEPLIATLEVTTIGVVEEVDISSRIARGCIRSPGGASEFPLREPDFFGTPILKGDEFALHLEHAAALHHGETMAIRRHHHQPALA
jgi:aspartyl-tRNA(Asn)/glutamyl-tRNA(Gln) amidotransferase subunit A